MIKLNKTQTESLNSLTCFETAEDRFGRSQAEIFRTDAAKLRKTVQFAIGKIGDAQKAKRDAILTDLGLTWLVSHSKKRDILSAWAKFAGNAGSDIVAKAKAGKLGKCSTIRGAVSSHEAKPKAKRQGKSGQGKKTVNFKAKKGGKTKAPTTVAAKLELIENFCKENGFVFTDFIAEWNTEASEAPMGKVAANG